MAYYIGLDLGGTNIKSGVVNDRGEIQGKPGSTPTNADKGPDAVIKAMAKAAKDIVKSVGLKLEQIDGIGVGAPGPMDIPRGIVRAAPNMPGWKDVPLGRRIAEETGRPTILENDANAAAFGEFWVGAGKDPGIRHMVMYTLGTGVGSGLVIDGKILHGAYSFGGEAGHMIVQPGGRKCGCGQLGCLEQYGSASSTVRRANDAIKAGTKSALEKFAAKLSAKDIFDAAKSGDKLAMTIVEETAKFLGIACVNICRVLDPQMIVFAGGMILAGDFLFERVRKSFTDNNWKVVESSVRIVPALLGNDAGFIGAAGVAWDAHRDGRLI